MLLKIPFIVLLCGIPAYVVGRSCNYNPYVNGCSIPGNLPYFYKRTFKPACNKHDICYSCAGNYSLNRYACDRKFYYNMLRLCRKRVCRGFARHYYWAVRRFGASHYRNSSPWWCKQSWVANCVF